MIAGRISEKIFFGILLYPIFLLGKLIPRNKNIWIFGAWFGNRFADSSRYVFEYVLKNNPEITPIWLTNKAEVISEVQNQGGCAYRINGFAGFWFGNRAGVTFMTHGYSDVNKYAVLGSKRVQLWHGVPLKKIHHDDKYNLLNPKNKLISKVKSIALTIFPFLDDGWELITSNGPVVTKRFISAFRANERIVQETGSPRTDIILDPTNDVTAVLPIINKNEKVILFAPTHRQFGNSAFDPFEKLDLVEFNRFLEKHNVRMYVKMHYCHEVGGSDENKNSTKNRIHIFTDQEAKDINKVLPFIDILITDYSSVYFDFLALDRPMIFTPFDIDNYLTDDRDMYEDYYSATPGPKCKNWEEVIENLGTILNGTDQYSDLRQITLKKYFKFVDNQNCHRVVECALKL